MEITTDLSAPRSRPTISAMSTQQSPTLPILTTLIGSGSFIIGIYSFYSPSKVAQIYGVPLPAHSSTSPAWVYAHGIRNFATGLSIMALTAYWQFKLPTPSKIIGRKAVGIVLLASSVIPMTDAMITWAYGFGENTKVGKTAARAHVMRSLVWIGGGLRCFWP